MPFQALTASPTLREGARLSFMAVPQPRDTALPRIAAGAAVTLRFGHCCPLIREGRIAAVDDTCAVLSVDGTEWALESNATGITIPGIVSENWVVTGRA